MLICGDSAIELKKLSSNYIDMILTSPPYDNLRNYEGYLFDFKTIANELYRILKPGGVMIWIVKDQHKNGNESGTSFKQALYFKEIGFNLYDTMIYAKNNFTFPHPKIYRDSFEYMFILSKGKPKTVNIIEDRKNKYGGTTTWGVMSQREKDGTLTQKQNKVIKQYGVRFNVWNYTIGYGNITKDKIAYKHPAIFPESLAKDHIISWSNQGDLILDPFAGSGTTLKMAKQLGRRYIGVEISPKYIEIIKERLNC